MWFNFFTPLVSKYQLENAYGLPYIGIHIIGLYVGFIVFAFVAFPVYGIAWVTKSEKEKHKWSEYTVYGTSLFAFVGSIGKLFAYMYVGPNQQDGLFWAYAVGHSIINMCLGVQLTMSLLVNKHFYKDVFAVQDLFGGASIGLVLSTLVVNGVYLDEDRYFTKTENAHRKNFIIMCV
jgi:hypothetical protein